MSVADSLLAVLLVIVTGWVVTARGWVKAEGWSGLQWLSYYVLYPCIIVDALARARLGGWTVVAIAAVLAAGVLAVTAILLLLRPLLGRAGIDGPAFASVFQGAARWQSFVAFGLAASLLGREGAAYVSIGVVAMIPLLNVLVVAVHLRWGTRRPGPMRLWLELAKNPFIVSCAVGIAFNLLGIGGPAALFGAFDILAKAGLAAVLILTGANLRMREAHRIDTPVVVASVLKLVVMPAIVLGLARLAGLDGTALVATIICASVPTATAAIILAQQMGGDVPLMARLATVQTLAAAVTMPAWIALVV